MGNKGFSDRIDPNISTDTIPQEANTVSMLYRNIGYIKDKYNSLLSKENNMIILIVFIILIILIFTILIITNVIKVSFNSNIINPHNVSKPTQPTQPTQPIQPIINQSQPPTSLPTQLHPQPITQPLPTPSATQTLPTPSATQPVIHSQQSPPTQPVIQQQLPGQNIPVKTTVNEGDLVKLSNDLTSLKSDYLTYKTLATDSIDHLYKDMSSLMPWDKTVEAGNMVGPVLTGPHILKSSQY